MTTKLLDLGPCAAVLLDHARERVDADGAEAVLSDRVLDETCDSWWGPSVLTRYEAEQDLVDAVARERDLRHGEHPFVVLGERAPASRHEALELAAEDVAAAVRRLILGPATA